MEVAVCGVGGGDCFRIILLWLLRCGEEYVNILGWKAWVIMFGTIPCCCAKTTAFDSDLEDAE